MLVVESSGLKGSQGPGNFSARLDAAERSNRLPVLENDQSGNGRDLEACGEFRRFINVYLRDHRFVRLLGRNFIEHRGEHFAWAAPFRPKVHEHRRAGGGDG
jgi:hypothetical protein